MTTDRRQEFVAKLRHIQTSDWLHQGKTGEADTALSNLAAAMAKHGNPVNGLNVDAMSETDVDELIGLCDQLLAAHGRRWQ